MFNSSNTQPVQFIGQVYKSKTNKFKVICKINNNHEMYKVKDANNKYIFVIILDIRGKILSPQVALKINTNTTVLLILEKIIFFLLFLK